MKKFIVNLFNKVCEAIFKDKTFWSFFFVMLFISLIDLISLRSSDFGAGFVITFFYFLFWIIYKMVKK